MEERNGIDEPAEETALSPATRNPVRPAPPGRPRIDLVALGLLGVALVAAGVVPRLSQQRALATSLEEQKEDAHTPTVETVTLPVKPPTSPSGASADKAKAAQTAGLILPASIQAIEETTINARTTGYLRQRFVDIGSRVQAGQLLAEIESPDVDQQMTQAQADLAKSQAGTGQAIADAARLTAGVSQSAADAQRSEAALDQARAGYKKSLAALAQAKVGVASALARQASSEQALEGRKGDLAQLKAQLVLDEKDRQRWQDLGSQGAVAQQAVDAKESAYQARMASISTADAAIRSAAADLEAAKQAVEASRSAVDSAQADVATSEQMVRAAQAQIASSRAAVQAAKASAASGKANIRAASAQAQSNSANLQRYAVLQGFEKVTAPFTGIITARNVDTGALITIPSAASAAPLFTLARTDTLRILVNVPQAYVRSIHNGEHVDVLVREFGGKPFSGSVYSTAGALDPQSRTLLTEIHVPNGGGTLLPGMYAQVRFPSGPKGKDTAGGLPRIPAEALITGADGTRVASVSASGTVHFLPVTVSRDYGTTLEISDGIQGNETLVLNPPDDLVEGGPVRIAKPAPTEKPAPAGAK